MSNRVTQLLKWKQNYGKGFGFSMLIHLVLFIFLVCSLETTYKPARSSQSVKSGEIVSAVMVDEKKVQTEMKKIEAKEKQQKMLVEERERKEAQKLVELKKEREQEQNKLKKLKEDMANAKKEEQNKLAEIKLAKDNEQKKLEKLKVEKAAEQKRLAALDDERAAEQERVKHAQLQRAKEEKKKEELNHQIEAKKKAEAEKQAALKAAEEKAALALENQRVSEEAQRILDEWGEIIKTNKREALGMASDLLCKLQVTVLPDGSVQVKLSQSSGNALYDDLSIKAVYKSQPFPLPEDPILREKFKIFEIGLRNDEGL